jgi:hypothetical protein
MNSESQPAYEPAPAAPDLPAHDPEMARLLEDDIRARGVVIPILVTEDGRIIDGKVRHEIATRHGLQCPRIVIGNLSPHERDDWRMAVNLYRRHLSQAQLRELIGWELRKNPQDSDRAIAGRVGSTHPTVAKVRADLESSGKITQSDHRTAKNGRSHPAAAKPMVFARGPVTERNAKKSLDTLGSDAPTGHLSQRQLNALVFQKKMQQEAKRPVAKLPAEILVEQGDFRSYDWSPYVGKVGVLLGDPPWLDEWRTNRRPYAELVARLLRPGGVMACYTGIYGMDEWCQVFREAGLKKQWVVACINEGSAKVRIVGKGKMTVQSSWRPIVVFSKGELHCDRVLYDRIETPLHEKICHPWQQPLSESCKLLDVFSRPGDFVADPTLGSGTSAVAVALAGRGLRYIGVEERKDYVKIARRRVSEALGRPSSSLGGHG